MNTLLVLCENLLGLEDRAADFTFELRRPHNLHGLS
jgi:hypothetical protein